MRNIEKLAISGVLRTPRLLLMMVAAAGLSHAAVTACATTSGTATALPSPAGTGNGCSSVDLNFENLVSSQTAGITYWANPGTINTAPTPDTLSTTTLNFASSVTGNPPTTGWFGPKNGSATYTLSYQTNNNGSNAPETNYAWAFSGISFAPTLTLNGGDVTTITYSFCFNATAGTAGSGGCVASNQGSFTVSYTRSGTQVVGSVTSSSYGSAISGPANGTAATILSLTTTSLQLTTSPDSLFSSMYLSTNIVMTANTGQFSSLTNLAIGYDQAAASTVPEPGTLGMMGAALVGFGLLARRKR